MHDTDLADCEANCQRESVAFDEKPADERATCHEGMTAWYECRQDIEYECSEAGYPMPKEQGVCDDPFDALSEAGCIVMATE